MRPGHAFEALLANAGLGALDPLPWPRALAAGAALGALAGGLGIRRSVARANLARAFPERAAAEREALLAAHYREMGRIAAEYGRLGRLVRAGEGEVMARVDGLEHVAPFVGRGAIFVSGHLGNFEFGAAWLARVNPVDFLVRPLTNRAVDARIERLRRDAGVGVISTRGGVKEVFRALRAGHWIGIAGDQDAGRHGVFVPFFGHDASTAEGAARIALQTGSPLFLGAIHREADGRHHMVLGMAREADGPPDDAHVRALTAWHTAELEARVREAPEQYFWLHRRWKTRPPAGTRREGG